MHQSTNELSMNDRHGRLLGSKQNKYNRYASQPQKEEILMNQAENLDFRKRQIRKSCREKVRK